MPDNETPIRTTDRSLDLQIYDNFDKPHYSLTDYAEKWATPYGLGEMAVNDTRNFSGGCLNLSAVPFQAAADVSVNDHLKYEAVSAHFSGARERYPRTLLGHQGLNSGHCARPDPARCLRPLGILARSGQPACAAGVSAPLRQGQQAAAVMNVLDFCTGQVFDWFVASDTAFALIERLPSTVTGNVTNPDCREAAEVGIDKMYTQIIREIPMNPDVWHHVDIALTRHDGDAWADYFLDHQPIAHVTNVGIPLHKQGASFTSIYPSAGPGEQVAGQLDSVRFGHGLFSLLDTFPFQHPEALELGVSIPVGSPSSVSTAGRARLFGQGASASFDNFTTLTVSGSAGPLSPSEIVNALAAAQA